MNALARFGSFIDRRYALILAMASPLFIWLNIDALGMAGVLPNYLEFKRAILSGFDASAFPAGLPTFPVWGYGVVLLITENKVALLAIQCAAAWGAAVALTRALERSRALTGPPLTFFKGLLAFSIPWYAVHALRWPYSFTASLLALVAAALAGLGGPRPFASAALAGSFMGLSLNFRSDHVLLPFCMGIVCLAVARFERRIVAGWAVFVVVSYAWMIPWAVYTKHATGRALFSSSNGGAVLLAGLGQLPDHPWGIEPHDGDPVTARILAERLPSGTQFTSLAASDVLKEEFLKRIKDAPGLYALKVAHAFRMTVVDGSYRGEFYETPECRPNCEAFYLARRSELLGNPFALASERPAYFSRMVLQIVSGLWSRAVVFLSFVVLPLTLWRALRERSVILASLASMVIYQTGIDAFLFHKSSSTSMVYLPHLFNLVAGGAAAVRALKNFSNRP